MALTGNALLAIWHDIEEASQDAYMEWHTREHMPERLSIPGFTVGKRLIRHDAGHHRYGTLYAGRDVEVFRSPAYLERLNNPTEWSLKVQPTFRHMLRVACDRLASAGTGDGGAVATIRLDLTGGAEALKVGAMALVEAVLGVTGVGCAHVALARTEVSDVRTRETELRPPTEERAFDALVIAEGSGMPELAAALPEIEAIVLGAGCGLIRPVSTVYALAWQLTAEQAAG